MSFLEKVGAFFKYIFIYSYPVLIALIYVGIFLLVKYEVLSFLPNHIDDIFENMYLTHKWQSWFEYFSEWALSLAESNFFIAFLGFLPIIAITLLLIIVEALLVIITGLINVIYGIVYIIFTFVVIIGLYVLVPPAVAVGSIILMIRQRADADDEIVLQTILCVLGTILSVVLCVCYFIACFSLF